MSSFLSLLLALLLIPALLPAAVLASEDSRPAAVSSAHAQEGEGETQEDGPTLSERDGLDEVVIWSLVGLAIFSAVLGSFYFFKRQVGGFPENPSWVAPITIMPSRDFPDEGDFGEQLPSHQAQAEH